MHFMRRPGTLLSNVVDVVKDTNDADAYSILKNSAVKTQLLLYDCNGCNSRTKAFEKSEPGTLALGELSFKY